ncbi:MAG TPA: hypothetical protein VG294_07275 [Solirubrobacteraceae bacterium]|nr:hypothetical protein [Solirubrobacteraceae bacterium]
MDARGTARASFPRSRLTDLLVEVAMSSPDIDVDDVSEEDWVEDQLMIDQVEPGKIWFEGGIGPIQVPSARANSLGRAGWCHRRRAPQCSVAFARGRLRLPVAGRLDAA